MGGRSVSVILLRIICGASLLLVFLLGGARGRTFPGRAFAAPSAKASCGARDVAYVKGAKGPIEARSKKGKWHASEKNAHVHAGDEVRTKKGAVASLHLCAGGTVYLNQKTELVVSDKKSAKVTKGESEAVFKQASEVISTKNTKVRMKGSKRASIDVRAEKSQTIVTAVEGSGEVAAKRGSITIDANHQTKVTKEGKPQAPTVVDAAALTYWSSRLAWTVVAKLGQDQPTKLAVDSQGNIYVAEEFQGRILKLSSSGKVMATWGGSGSAAGEFGRPRGIAVDSSGNVYVADTSNSIDKLSPNGQRLATWGSYGSDPGEFNFPSGVALDSAGNIYVADTGNGRIQKLSPTGQPLAQWGAAGLNLGQFRGPEGITLDRAGNIYVADWGDVDFVDRVIKLSPAGTFLAQWGGKQGTAPGQFNTPYDITIDASGTLYVAETGNARVQEISSTDGHSLGILGTHGTATGQFDFGDPSGVAVDRNGNLYTAEEGNHRVQKYAP